MQIRDRIVELRRVPASELRPNPKNWRTHPKAQQEALRGILAEVGYADALLARETDEGLQIIDGHLRAEVTPNQEVPVLVLDVTEEEADKLLATIDPLAALAGKDENLLRDLLDGIETDNEALRRMFDDLVPPEAGTGLTDPDDVPEPPEEPVTRPGDLWLLGEHRLLCGDATNPDNVRSLMDGQKAALFQTDPPYLVDYTGADRPNDSGKDWSDRYHEVEIKDAEGFFTAVFSNALGITTPNAAWYCWHAHKRAALIERIWVELGVLNHQQIVWVKPSAMHTYSMWPWRHEPCLMGWQKGHKPSHDGDNSHRFTTVWEVDWEGKARIVGNQHPTQKPVALFERPMLKHTARRDICFEPFSGSGSQLIAAERLQRRCYALEIEPRFCDVPVRRWEEFTGKKATRHSVARRASIGGP